MRKNTFEIYLMLDVYVKHSQKQTWKKETQSFTKKNIKRNMLLIYFAKWV